MYSIIFLKSFRILLFPLSILYGLVIFCRNKLFDKKIFHSVSFGLPVICIGNLSVGGTGKSPMVEFIAQQFQKEYELAILSRGFKRKTKGYCLANENSTALDIGDEPKMFLVKFPNITVAVGEERIEAIPQLLHDRPNTQCILLDDAFQHRSITAGLHILLTDYNDLFTRDFFLPTGNLRDAKASSKRAEIIVVTKCPSQLSEKEKRDIIKEISPSVDQQIYFTSTLYAELYHISDSSKKNKIDIDTEVLLVTGIANPKTLKDVMLENSKSYHLMQFPDHHIFTIDDWVDIKKKFEQMDEHKKIIVTTEKDAIRFIKFGKELDEIPFYVLPMSHQFLFNEENVFTENINNFIKQFNRLE